MKNAFRKTVVLLVAICVLCTLLTAFAACTRKDDDKLYVAMECAYAPFNYTQTDAAHDAVQIYDANYKADSGKYANGYDVMIASRIAKALGKELVVVRMDWDSLIPAINMGTVDLVLAGMSPTAERKEAIDFSEPYYQSQLVIVVRNDGQYASATSLNDFGEAKIVAQNGTFHSDALSLQGPAYGIDVQTPMATFPEMINALKTRAIDGYIAEEPGAIENCASNPEFTYIRLQNNAPNGGGFAATDADVAIAVGMKKGSDLLAAVNDALAQISQEERKELMALAIAYASGQNVEL